MENIIVSIVCSAYNQEKYIADTIESFVMQQTNFEFEILIHDDASTDKTADIIREYEKKYPSLIKPIYQTENQYSKGGVGQFQYPRAKGKYIAVCEGDDYWTDPLKLQKQVDLLEKHPECDMCAHAAVAVNAQSKRELYKISPSNVDTTFSTEEVILGGGGFVATNSLLYRRELVDNIPRFREFLQLDYTLQIQGSLRGGMIYSAQCMSAYRVNSDNSWSKRMSSDTDKMCMHIKKVNKMLELLDDETNYKYTQSIHRHIQENEVEIMEYTGQERALFSKEYKNHLKNLSKKKIIKLWLKGYMSFVLRLFK